MTNAKSVSCLLVALAFTSDASAQDNLSDDKIKALGSGQTKLAVFHQSGGSDKGVQVFTPVELNFRSQDWDFGIKTAHIYSERKSSFAGGSGSVSTFTDTVLSGTYRAYAGNVDWLNDRRATLAINADINLPTGKEQLTGSEKNAVFDSFLVDQDRFGEGLNGGLGFSSTLSLAERTLVGFGASYIARGDYNPDGDNPNRRLSPGNHFVTTTQILHKTDRFKGKVGYRLINETATKVDGVATYDRSLSHEFFASASYYMNEQWISSISGYYATRGADRSLNTISGQLEKSASDDNGDTYLINAGLSYLIDQDSVLGINASYKKRGKNEFNEANFSFKPDFMRVEVGAHYEHRFDNGLRINAQASYFEVEEGSILGFNGPKFTGFTIGLGVSRAF